MLRIWANRAGRRVGTAVALLYFLGVVMPSVVLACATGAVSAYCFDELAQDVAALQIRSGDHVHAHSDGTLHHHVDKTSRSAVQGPSQKDDQGGTGSQDPSSGHTHHDANCCGLYGFAAVLPALSRALDEPANYLIQQPILTNCLAGCAPDRINRPPITPLPR